MRLQSVWSLAYIQCCLLGGKRERERELQREDIQHHLLFITKNQNKTNIT
eukprot:gene1816-1102_t